VKEKENERKVPKNPRKKSENASQDEEVKPGTRAKRK